MEQYKIDFITDELYNLSFYDKDKFIKHKAKIDKYTDDFNAVKNLDELEQFDYNLKVSTNV